MRPAPSRVSMKPVLSVAAFFCRPSACGKLSRPAWTRARANPGNAVPAVVLGRTAAIGSGTEWRQGAGLDGHARWLLWMMPVGIRFVKRLASGERRAYHVDEMVLLR